jgi:hypothetical protein
MMRTNSLALCLASVQAHPWDEADARIRAALDRSAEHDAACLREIDRLPSLRAGLAEHCAVAKEKNDVRMA